MSVFYLLIYVFIWKDILGHIRDFSNTDFCIWNSMFREKRLWFSYFLSNIFLNSDKEPYSIIWMQSKSDPANRDRSIATEIEVHLWLHIVKLLLHLLWFRYHGAFVQAAMWSWNNLIHNMMHSNSNYSYLHLFKMILL